MQRLSEDYIEKLALQINLYERNCDSNYSQICFSESDSSDDELNDLFVLATRGFVDSVHSLHLILIYQKDFKTSLNELESLHVIRHHSPSTVVCDSNQKLLYLLCWLIQPFLISYLVMCQVLRQVAVIPLSEINILRASQQRIEEMFLTKSISQPYSLSLETQGCSILSLVSCGALIRHKANGEVKYHAVDSKLADIIQNISVLLSALHQEKDTVNISKSFAKEILSNGSRSKL